MTYKVAKMMIINGNYEYNDMLKKLDIFLLGNRITEDQYNELIGLMAQE